MTREEYDILIKQKEEISRNLRDLGYVAREILDETGVDNDGEVSVSRIDGEIAYVHYLEPGCHNTCCGKDYGSTNFPASWLFGADWRSEVSRQREERERRRAEQEAADAERSRLEQEAGDRAQFERLKAKFQSQSELGC